MYTHIYMDITGVGFCLCCFFHVGTGEKLSCRVKKELENTGLFGLCLFISRSFVGSTLYLPLFPPPRDCF